MQNASGSLPVVAEATERRRGLRLSYRRQEVLWGYLFMAPTIVGLVVFVFGPALASIALALFSTNFITQFEFVGLANFGELFADETFWVSARNTVLYVVLHVVP